MAIADAFEAMTSPRPYRGPMSNEDALREITRNAGTQFDPNIVDVFVTIAPSMLPEEVEANGITEIPNED